MNKKLEELSKEIVTISKQKGLTIASAESFTGGLIAKSITDIPGSSDVLICGLVTYQIKAKIDILGVDEQVINQYGVVSKETVIKMAEQAMKLSNADLVISSTGYAGPNDGENNGFVFLGIIYKQNGKLKKIYRNYKLPFSRTGNRTMATYLALKKVKEIIINI